MPTYDVFGSDPREERARRQMALAQALQAQAFQPIQPESSRLGPAPIHPLQGLAQLLKAYGGRRKEERSTEEMQKLAEERRRELAFALGPQAGIKPNEPATRATRESISGVLGGSQTPAHQQMALMLRLGAIEGEEGQQKALERIMLESQLRPQVPGRDVPYSPEVMAQLAQIREAGRPTTTVTTNIGPTSPGRIELDKKFAEEYMKWKTQESSDYLKQRDQLDSALGALESGEELTGPIIGAVPDAIKKFTSPRSIAVRELVEEVVQRNLRLILGPQFTEKEGERLIARAYNENLPEEENARRLRRLMAQMDLAAQQKDSAARYFEQNNTLQGWEGKLFTIKDFTEMTFEPDPDEDTVIPGLTLEESRELRELRKWRSRR